MRILKGEKCKKKFFESTVKNNTVRLLKYIFKILTIKSSSKRSE